MVYRIYMDGENIDAEFGQPVVLNETFIGNYGEALQRAEEVLRLIDFGFVSVIEKALNVKNEKTVYIANKKFDKGVYREELI